MAVSDDDVIKRKLLLEGERGNDDTRLNNLLKTFIKWCNSPDCEDGTFVHDTHQKMLLALAQSEYAMDKNLQVCLMNQQEQAKYSGLNNIIEEKIEDAYEKISECKRELVQAKRVRRNRQEYDALAKVIQQHPDRKETTQKLEKLGTDIETMKSSKAKLDQKLDLRKKQFHVLMAAIHEIQRVLEEDDDVELPDDDAGDDYDAFIRDAMEVDEAPAAQKSSSNSAVSGAANGASTQPPEGTTTVNGQGSAQSAESTSNKGGTVSDSSVKNGTDRKTSESPAT